MASQERSATSGDELYAEAREDPHNADSCDGCDDPECDGCVGSNLSGCSYAGASESGPGIHMGRQASAIGSLSDAVSVRSVSDSGPELTVRSSSPPKKRRLPQRSRGRKRRGYIDRIPESDSESVAGSESGTPGVIELKTDSESEKGGGGHDGLLQRRKILERLRGACDRLRRAVSRNDELVPFFITVTYPGGITDEQVRRMDTYLRGVNHGGTGLYVLEDGDGSKHRHIHAIIWYSCAKRTDSVTRSLRNTLFSDDEISNVTGTRRLVRSETCVDLSGLFLYVAKERDIEDGRTRGDANVRTLFRCCGDIARQYHSIKCETADLEVFPAEGKTKWISDQKLPDVLQNAAGELGVTLDVHKSFSNLVAQCLRKGLRFNFRALRQARIVMEILQGDAGGWAETEIHQLATDSYVSKI